MCFRHCKGQCFRMNIKFIGHGLKRLESTSYPWQQAMRKMDKRGA